jgi:hypothetical protein
MLAVRSMFFAPGAVRAVIYGSQSSIARPVCGGSHSPEVLRAPGSKNEEMAMRHALGVLGVLAAGVLLAVSAAMNWRFGYTLGKTELDGFIYGSASAAADCLKALVPFFFFAAMRNRMWSQAGASALVWVVVTAYSLTSALGHAALNRMDTTGQRAIEAQSYKDHRADLKRAEDQLGWIPQHRPAAAVQSELGGLKNRREWTWTKSCTDVSGKTNRDFCQGYHRLTAEHASAQQAAALEARIGVIRAKLDRAEAATAMAEADPQAAVLTKLAGLFLPDMKVEDMQTGLAIFVALLLEVGSAFGMYIAFSQWRLDESEAPAIPAIATIEPAATAVTAPAPIIASSASSANDNRSALKLVAPDTDVERYHKERIVSQEGASITGSALHEDYKAWCAGKNKEPLSQSTFCREFGELSGIQKTKRGSQHYIGIALKSGLKVEQDGEDKKLSALVSRAA